MKTRTLIALAWIGFSGVALAQTEQKEKKKLLDDDTELVYTAKGNDKEGPVLIKDVKTNKIFLKGMHTANKPSGKWYFYNESGNLESYYNYDQKKLLYIDSAFLNKIQVTIKSQDKEAVEKASIPILLYPSALLVKQITNDINIPASEFTGRTEIPLRISAIIKPNGHVDYVASYTSGKKQINLPFEPTNKEFEKIFIPAQYNGKAIESVFTMNTVANNEAKGPGHRRFTWNY